MVSSDQSKYLESISKLARILEKSKLSRAEERKLLTKMMKRRDNVMNIPISSSRI